MDVSDELTIDYDIECYDCRYNLRGLSGDGNCPECGSPIAKSFAVHEKSSSSHFRRIKPNRLRMLLIAHVVLGIVYLVFYVVPQMIQQEPWIAAYKIRLLFIPGLSTAAVLGISTLILAIANRDRMSVHKFRRFMIVFLVASVPQVISLIIWSKNLM